MGKLHRAGLILAVAALAVLLALCTQPASALAKDYSLPSKITSYVYEDGKFIKQGTYPLKYTKGGFLKDPHKIKEIFGREFGVLYKNGRIRHASYSVSYCTFSYDRKGRVSKVKSETDKSCYSKSVLSYQYHSGGAKKAVTCKTTYFEGKEKTRGKYSVNLDRDGFVTKAKWSNEFTKSQYKYQYKKDGKGRVKSITVKSTEKGKTATVAKYKLSYSKAKKTSSKNKMLAIVNAAPLQYAEDFTAVAVFDGKKGYNPLIEYWL